MALPSCSGDFPELACHTCDDVVACRTRFSLAAVRQYVGDGPSTSGPWGTEESLGRDGLVVAIVVLVGCRVAALVWCALCRAPVRCGGLPADVDVWVAEVGVDGAEPVVEVATVWVEACVFVDPPHAVSPLAANRVTISDQRAPANRGRRELRPMSIASGRIASPPRPQQCSPRQRATITETAVASNPTWTLPREEYE
jgi:hypothetical protein